MKYRNQKVEKDLSPDESAIIADIESLLNQLKQGEAAEGPEGGPGLEDVNMDVITDGQPAGDEEQEELEDDKIVGKDETANSSADQRLDELPEDDEEALKVLKALIGVGKSADRKPVRRVVETARRSGDSRALAMIAKSLAILAKKVDRVEDSMVGVLEGIGVAESLVQKSAATRRPVQARQADVQALVDVLKSAMVGKSADAEPEAPGSMKDVLTTLVGR